MTGVHNLSKIPMIQGLVDGDTGEGDGPVGDAVSMDVAKFYVVVQRYPTNAVSVRGQKTYAVIEE